MSNNIYKRKVDSHESIFSKHFIKNNQLLLKIMAKPKIDKAPIVSYLWKRNVHKKYVMIPNAAPKPVNNVMKTSFVVS